MDVLVVVVVTAFLRRAPKARQTSERPFLVHVYDTRFTVREVPTLAHFVPRMSGTTPASAGMARCATTTSPTIAPEIKRFIISPTKDEDDCDKESPGV